MREYESQQLQESAKDREKEARALAETVALRAHHLISTKNVKGVLKPLLTKPKILGEPAEDFVKDVCKKKRYRILKPLDRTKGTAFGAAAANSTLV